MPLVSCFTIIYYVRKKNYVRNPLKYVSSRLWLFTGINIMIIAFGFSTKLQSHLTPIILLLLGIATAVAGSFIRSRLLLFCGLVLNISAYTAFFIPLKQHPLLMGTVSLVAFLLPGIILHFKNKNYNV
jgi:hypothetical protein